MARPLRIEFPGATYHVMARGIDGREIFLSHDEKAILTGLFFGLCDRYNFTFYAYCIMDNHYHLLLTTPDANLSRGMHWLNGDYASWYNRKHRRCGTLFQGRYKAFVVDREEYLLSLARYIVLNPVRAAIVSRPSSYVWSSYRDTAGTRQPPHFLAVDPLLCEFSSHRSEAQRQYRNFVHQGIGVEVPRALTAGPVIGGVDFLDKISGYISKKRQVAEIPRIQRFQNRLSLPDIFSHPEDRRSKPRRNEKIYVAFRDHGYTQKEIADFLGLHYSTLSPIIKSMEDDR
jgi:putative transposase